MRTDVLVVGAGSAGAHCATLLAESGFSVVLADRRPQGKTGAAWVNGVVPSMLASAGVTPLLPEEIHSQNNPFLVFSPQNYLALKLTRSPLADINMSKFTGRLLGNALRYRRCRGLFDSELVSLEFTKGRPKAAHFKTPHGTQIVHADWYVDASGSARALLQKLSPMHPLYKAKKLEPCCTALQYIYEVSNRQGCSEFLDRFKINAGDMATWMFQNGGLSVFRIQVSENLQTISFLIGATVKPGKPSASKMLAKFLEEHTWVSQKPISGGQRIIPLGAPLKKLAADRVAVVGDAANHVYGAHGSGVGFGLLGAKSLADALTQDPDSNHLKTYTTSFYQQNGTALTHGYTLKILSDLVSEKQAEKLLRSGLLEPHTFRQALSHEPIRLNYKLLPRGLKAAFKLLTASASSRV